MEITKEQIAAIKFFDELMHPSILGSVVQSGSRDGWLAIDAHLSELLKLLPKEEKPS